MPKQLIPVANKPVLLHGLEMLRDAGVEEIGIVVGAHREEIEAAVGTGLGVPVTYLPQDRPRGLAHCVSIARDFLGDDDFVMYLGDNVLAGGVTEMVEEFRCRRPDAQLAVTKVADPRAYGVAEVDADGNVLALVEKPQQPRSDLALIGVYFFTPAIHEAVRQTPVGARGEYEITDAIARLLAGGGTVTAHTYQGYWKDTGRIDDLLECNRTLLELTEPRVAGQIDAASELIGPVVIEEGARVTGSRVVGPTVIGAGTVVANCTIGPYTAIGRSCLLQDSGVHDSIVLDSVVLHGVPDIRGSVIGRHAKVRALPTTAQHRLVIGDHTEVEVAA